MKVAFIFARGGSKGVPRKNLRNLAGQPLIAYSIQLAQASKHIERVIVSTDDAEIAEVAQKFGAEVPFIRPSELAQDRSPEWLAWQHAIQTVGLTEQDVFISLPPTSPLRTVEDVDRAIEAFIPNEVDVVVTVRPAERNPYFNMVQLDEQNYAHLVIPPAQNVTRRQDAPTVYDLTTVAYVANPQFILNQQGLFSGRMRTVLIPTEHSLDIDIEWDFQLAEYLMSKQLGMKP